MRLILTTFILKILSIKHPRKYLNAPMCTSIALIIIYAAPVLASNMYLCTGKTLVNWDRHEYQSYNNQDFGFVENGNTITSGSGGYFNKPTLPITYYAAPGTFTAENDYTRIVFWKNMDFFSASIGTKV